MQPNADAIRDILSRRSDPNCLGCLCDVCHHTCIDELQFGEPDPVSHQLSVKCPHCDNIVFKSPAHWAYIEHDAILDVLRRRDSRRLCVECGHNDEQNLSFDPDWRCLTTLTVRCHACYVNGKSDDENVVCRIPNYWLFSESQLSYDDIATIIQNRRHRGARWGSVLLDCEHANCKNNIRLDPEPGEAMKARKDAIEKLDRDHEITTVKCNKCNTVVFTGCRDVADVKYRRLYSEQILPGDEIAWHRPVCAPLPTIWHHAIAFKQSVGSPPKVDVFHYNTIPQPEEHICRRWCSCIPNCCRKANEIRNEVVIRASKEDIYAVEYPESYAWSYVIERAKSRVAGSCKQQSYSLPTQNCEHFTRWAKTGKRESLQSQHCFKQVLKIILFILLRGTAFGTLFLLDFFFVPDNGVYWSLEIILSCIFSFIYVLLMKWYELRSQINRTRGRLQHPTKSCCYCMFSHDICTRVSCHNYCGVISAAIVECLISWITPLLGISLFMLYLLPIWGQGWTYGLAAGIFLISSIVLNVFGRCVGRVTEQLVDYCSKRRELVTPTTDNNNIVQVNSNAMINVPEDDSQPILNDNIIEQDNSKAMINVLEDNGQPILNDNNVEQEEDDEYAGESQPILNREPGPGS